MIAIDSFKNFFEGFERQYVIIGGTACELLMSENELPFRATKDLDIVLIIESLTKDFGDRFWRYVEKAGYTHINKSSGTPQCYRFSHPISTEYPKVIELFSKNQDWLTIENDQGIIPIHISDEISSLSAILLDETYYEFLRQGIKIVNGISILDVEHIIPFKAKAWIDLKKRKECGDETVDTKDIRKHRKDIFRLSDLLIPSHRVTTDKVIKEDLIFFIEEMKKPEIDLRQMGFYDKDKNAILDLLCQIYDLPLSDEPD